jgi:hypothetical protein
MEFIQIINEDYYDSNLLKTSGMKPIVDAIKNRRPITFMYKGPATGPEKVKGGTRTKVEPVALGLTKKNKMAIRAWVPSPNVSQKGLEQNQWRTFLLSRMFNIKVDLDSNYEGPKPGFNSNEKEGSPYWPLIKIYAATDFSAEPKKPKKSQTPTVKPSGKKPIPTEPMPQVEPEEPTTEPEIEPMEPQVEPTTEPQAEPTTPETEPTNQELPQPKPSTKPSKTPPRLSTQQPKTKEKPSATPPTSVEPETPEVAPEQNPEEDENNQLKESLKRIKRLMYS